MGGQERRLVTVRRVREVRPIPGADRIEAVIVDGWTCVCRVGKFRVRELALFFEIDSFLPAKDRRWSYLKGKFCKYGGSHGFRVQSENNRGQMSQGVLRRLRDFPEVKAVFDDLKKQHESKEAAEEALLKLSFGDLLGVMKCDAQPLRTQGSGKPEEQMGIGPVPDCILKTDQERIQNMTDVFAEWGDKVFQESTKMDGSSMTAYFLRSDSPHYSRLPPTNPTGGTTGMRASGRFGVCSRNLDLVERTASPFWQAALKNKLPEKLEALGWNLAVQGEMCGSSIQRNCEGFPAGFLDFFVFGIWDIDKQKQVPPREVERLAAELELRHVPVHGYVKLKELGTSVRELLRRADGEGLNGQIREGIVLKLEDGTFSFKAISNRYLLGDVNWTDPDDLDMRAQLSRLRLWE